MSARLLRALAAVAALSSLAACGDDSAALQAWMDEVRANTQPVREKIDEPRRFEPFRYERAAGSDPFARTRLAGLVPDEPPAAADSSGSGLQPDTRRPRGPLERFPLDAIRMVGYLSNARQRFALLQAGGVVYRVGLGDHAGQDHGTITHVDDDEVVLRELVQDAGGEWTARETRLRLQEGNP